MPLSEDALAFARKLAASRYRYPDDRIAIADLLERWDRPGCDAGGTLHGAAPVSRAEGHGHLRRRLWCLPAVGAEALEGASPPAGDGTGGETGPPGEEPEAGDDDAEDLEMLEAEESGIAGDDDFYADALGDE
jgi:hypothetical protein